MLLTFPLPGYFKDELDTQDKSSTMIEETNPQKKGITCNIKDACNIDTSYYRTETMQEELIYVLPYIECVADVSEWSFIETDNGY